jgi:lipopolysaccharide export system protein LptA
MSVTADQGQASRGLGNFENSHWVFRGNVKITMEQGQLTSDEADVTFIKKLLSKAVDQRQAGQFRARIEKTGKPRSGTPIPSITTSSKGIVRLSEERLAQRRPERDSRRVAEVQRAGAEIVAEAAEQGSQRVHIIITPPRAPSHERAAGANLAKSYKSRQVLQGFVAARSRAARSSACWARTAPARPRLST